MFSLVRALPPPPPQMLVPPCSAGSSVIWRGPTPPGRACRLAAYRLRGPASLPVGTRRPGGLPVLVHVVSRRARVLRLRRTGQPLASSRSQPYCLLPFSTGSASLIQRFSKLDSPAHRYPCLRFDGHLAAPPARLGAKMESLLLSRRTLAFPATCRLFRKRSPFALGPAVPTAYFFLRPRSRIQV
jgi:hypothetical protein